MHTVLSRVTHDLQRAARRGRQDANAAEALEQLRTDLSHHGLEGGVAPPRGQAQIDEQKTVLSAHSIEPRDHIAVLEACVGDIKELGRSAYQSNKLLPQRQGLLQQNEIGVSQDFYGPRC